MKPTNKIAQLFITILITSLAACSGGGGGGGNNFSLESLNPDLAVYEPGMSVTAVTKSDCSNCKVLYNSEEIPVIDFALSSSLAVNPNFKTLEAPLNDNEDKYPVFQIPDSPCENDADKNCKIEVSIKKDDGVSNSIFITVSKKSTNCQEGDVFTNGACVKQCGENENLTNGICTPDDPCLHITCQTNEICKDSLCVTQLTKCNNSKDCKEAEECDSQGNCVTKVGPLPCTDDKQCGENENCINQTCSPTIVTLYPWTSLNNINIDWNILGALNKCNLEDHLSNGSLDGISDSCSGNKLCDPGTNICIESKTCQSDSDCGSNQKCTTVGKANNKPLMLCYSEKGSEIVENKIEEINTVKNVKEAAAAAEKDAAFQKELYEKKAAMADKLNNLKTGSHNIYLFARQKGTPNDIIIYAKRINDGKGEDWVFFDQTTKKPFQVDPKMNFKYDPVSYFNPINGNVELYVVNTVDNYIYRISATEVNNTLSFNKTPVKISDGWVSNPPTVFFNKNNGSTYVFTSSNNGIFYYEKDINGKESITNYTKMAQVKEGSRLAVVPSQVYNGFDVFWRGKDDYLYHSWSEGNHNPERIGTAKLTGSPVATFAKNKNLVVFAMAQKPGKQFPDKIPELYHWYWSKDDNWGTKVYDDLALNDKTYDYSYVEGLKDTDYLDGVSNVSAGYVRQKTTLVITGHQITMACAWGLACNQTSALYNANPESLTAVYNPANDNIEVFASFASNNGSSNTQIAEYYWDNSVWHKNNNYLNNTNGVGSKIPLTYDKPAIVVEHNADHAIQIFAKPANLTINSRLFVHTFWSASGLWKEHEEILGPALVLKSAYTDNDLKNNPNLSPITCPANWTDAMGHSYIYTNWKSGLALHPQGGSCISIDGTADVFPDGWFTNQDLIKMIGGYTALYSGYITQSVED